MYSICKDCKHYKGLLFHRFFERIKHGAFLVPLCNNPKVKAEVDFYKKNYSFISGKLNYQGFMTFSCWDQRNSYDNILNVCGKDAKWFEPKE